MHDIHSRNLEEQRNTKCNVRKGAGSTPSVQGGGDVAGSQHVSEKEHGELRNVPQTNPRPTAEITTPSPQL
jgi:hypothetical protein